jgi:folate-binding Fe-S cluster repair protein YgfZ
VGQEAIAKLDNLGRPRRVLVPFTAEGTVPAGDIVLAHGDEVGRVTSAVTIDGETRGLARVKAAAENGSLTTADGTRLG